MLNFKQIFSTNKNVSKFVFKNEDESIAVEAVLYKYPDFKTRTVLCVSTQCGCPVGCTFCGTGRFFARSLTSDEIIEQVESALSTIDCDTAEIEKFQIMFMSMGEPMLNLENLKSAIIKLHSEYPTAQLLVSTSAPYLPHTKWTDFFELARQISKVGLQFSVHESNDEDRQRLIPTHTTSLKEIGALGEEFASLTNRKPFFNYCVHEGNNDSQNVSQLLENFNPAVWECTLSVICETDEKMSAAIERQLERIQAFSQLMTAAGYSIRVFNPAGQDDIGGGCGQLWYFQKWAKEKSLQFPNL